MCVCVCVSCTGVPDQINHSLIVTTPISLASMTVSFPTPSDNNAPITAYTYMLCQGTCANSPTPVTTMDYRVSGGDTEFTIGDLVPNSVYTLRVAAVMKQAMEPHPLMILMLTPSTPSLVVRGCVCAWCACVCRDWRNCVHKIHIILSIVAFFKDLNVNLTFNKTS